MKHLSIDRSLVINVPAIIAFYGAGGKTTLMLKLANEMTALGHKVLLTTTTKIFSPPEIPLFCDHNIEHKVQSLQEHFKHSDTAVLGKKMLPGGKIEGLEPASIEYLRNKLAVSVLVEADGAKKMPIKGHAAYEPVLPASSDLIISLIGADALGAALTPASVHRLKEYLQVTGAEEGDLITEKLIADTFKHMFRIGRNQAPRARIFSVLNKADLLQKPGPSALKIAKFLCKEHNRPERFLLTEGTGLNPVTITLNLDPEEHFASVSCVVLAAGESSRMGRAKLSLRSGNKTILEQTLTQAAGSGLKDIVVVTGPESPCSETIKASGFKLVENPSYKTGMASSLKAGLNAVDITAQGVIFALADQPQVPSEIYSSLYKKYNTHLSLCTFPVYRGQRGNPALFDRRLWPDLMNLSGDQGGRAVLNNLRDDQIDCIETNTPAVLLDIDSPEDYLFYLSYLASSQLF